MGDNPNDGESTVRSTHYHFTNCTFYVTSSPTQGQQSRPARPSTTLQAQLPSAQVCNTPANDQNHSSAENQNNPSGQTQTAPGMTDDQFNQWMDSLPPGWDAAALMQALEDPASVKFAEPQPESSSTLLEEKDAPAGAEVSGDSGTGERGDLDGDHAMSGSHDAALLP